MAYWAEIDENNLVTRILVGDNNDPNGDEGYQWLLDNLGGRWVKTSYNSNIRKHFAGIGFRYDERLDAFIPPKNEPSWILDEGTCLWKPPIPYPSDGLDYIWVESELNWVLEEK